MLAVRGNQRGFPHSTVPLGRSETEALPTPDGCPDNEGEGHQKQAWGGASQKIRPPECGGPGMVCLPPWLKEPLGQPLECDERGAPPQGA